MFCRGSKHLLAHLHNFSGQFCWCTLTTVSTPVLRHSACLPSPQHFYSDTQNAFLTWGLMATNSSPKILHYHCLFLFTFVKTAHSTFQIILIFLHFTTMTKSTLNQMNINSHLTSFFSSRLLPLQSTVLLFHCSDSSIYCILHGVPKRTLVRGPRLRTRFLGLFVCLWPVKDLH